MQLFIVILILFLSACSHSNLAEDENPYRDIPDVKLYEMAQTAIKHKEYVTATQELESLNSLYPFSDYARKADLLLIDVYYKKEEYTAAAASADNFIHLYPRDPNAEYAYYKKAMAHFHQNRGTLITVLPFDVSWRDPGTQKDAYNDFAMLLELYPNGKYTKIAHAKMQELTNLNAQHELHVAEFYYTRKMLVAAKARALVVLKDYPKTKACEGAARLVKDIDKTLME
jgi:outer membrane protein assembly factor BamD